MCACQYMVYITGSFPQNKGHIYNCIPHPHLCSAVYMVLVAVITQELQDITVGRADLYESVCVTAKSK